ncbi:MAG: putative isomerase [Saprospiraceae bacterium]|nr:MAG: putative isomerase [Saprospiraceae bacterium]
MTLDIYQIDAFADQLFQGNPAAVCPLKHWLSDDLLQKIATENNLSETAFFVPEGKHFNLRWFTPALEVDLCGHATLASAHVLFQHLNYPDAEITFKTRSGPLVVSRKGDQYVMNFPTDQIEKVVCPPLLAEALKVEPEEVWQGREDFLVIIDSEARVAQLKPDFRALLELGGRGVIVSAPGDQVDFVSRGFFPCAGIDEDPVTGSAHTTLSPYWAKRLGKNQLHGRQISARCGDVFCELQDSRVNLRGRAVSYLQGKLFLSVQ